MPKKFIFNPPQIQFTLVGARNVVPKKFIFNPSQIQFTPKTNQHNFVLSVLFQSLTGSIHTEPGPITLALEHGFQSLTSSIHTGYNISISFVFKRFNPSQVQFTLIHYKNNILFNFVSIPHRFNSHATTDFDTPIINSCFNPSQVQFTQKLEVCYGKANRCFNPSQVQFTHASQPASPL